MSVTVASGFHPPGKHKKFAKIRNLTQSDGQCIFSLLGATPRVKFSLPWRNDRELDGKEIVRARLIWRRRICGRNLMKKFPARMVFGFGVLLLIIVFAIRQLYFAKEASLPITPDAIRAAVEDGLNELMGR